MWPITSTRTRNKEAGFASREEFKMRWDMRKLGNAAVICELVGVLLLLALMFVMHPLVLTIFMPLSIGLVLFGFGLWVAAMIRYRV